MKYRKCRCGVDIPSVLERCDECRQRRIEVEANLYVTGDLLSHRVKVRRRQQILMSAMRHRPASEPPKPEETTSKPKTGPKPESVPVVRYPITDEAQAEVLRIVERKRILVARRRVNKAQHEMIPVAVKEWLYGE